MHLANTNALVWAIGNGLVSTSLVTYLALGLGASGIAIGLILSAPHLAGLLRLVAPAMMTTGQRRKVVCLTGYLASAMVLVAMPQLAAPREGLDPAIGIATLVICWCVYHLLEYIATIALWSWLGDWMPPPVRGRLVGWRERFLVVGRIVGVTASVLLSFGWEYLDPSAERWVPLYWSASVGAGMLVLAVVPLLWLAPRTSNNEATPTNTWRAMARVLSDRKYASLLLYSCWFAAANGITSSAQAIYPWRVLDINYHQLVGLRSMMYAGQTAMAPTSGWWIDRFGARRLMTICQLIVATGPLFFLISTPSYPWWVAGAFVVWMFYAPLNVSLDTLKLKLVPIEQSAPALAVYYATSDLAFSATALLGSAYYDRLREQGLDAWWLFATFFLSGWVLRSIAAWLVWLIPDIEGS
ncbi:MFS transporter [Aeoliella mucimassa]|nr:MFS transporter [Aeoliella mucimassa]